jgi:methylated-DNA-[protein]-cysteine S-methyltransferase
MEFSLMPTLSSLVETNTSANIYSSQEANSRNIKAKFEGFVSELHTTTGYIRMYANEKAITKIKFYDTSVIEYPNHITELAKVEMAAYLAGELRQFTLPLAPAGTPFQRSVWEQLLNIEYGETASYLDIAKAINNPKACRAVGAANGKNPIAIVIPCHRIVGANGSLTGYAGGLARKSFLLNLEQ